MYAIIPTNANEIHRYLNSYSCLDTRNANIVEIFVKSLKAGQKLLFKVTLKNGPNAVLARESFTNLLAIISLALLVLFKRSIFRHFVTYL